MTDTCKNNTFPQLCMEMLLYGNKKLAILYVEKHDYVNQTPENSYVVNALVPRRDVTSLDASDAYLKRRSRDAQETLSCD